MMNRFKKGQATYRQKQREAGKKAASFWLEEDDKAEIKRIQSALDVSNQNEALSLILRFTRQLSVSELVEYMKH